MSNTRKRALPIDAGAAAATMTTLEVADLAGVAYSAGKTFDGLRTDRSHFENSLRSGSLEGISSRSDLALLEDFRDVAQFSITNRDSTISSAYVRALNAQITRSGPLRPGQYRTAAQQIGVSTRYGRHEPQAISDAALKRIIDGAMAMADPREQALELFVQIAKTQPLEDGNKRTALFVANSVLIREPERRCQARERNNFSSSRRSSSDETPSGLAMTLRRVLEMMAKPARSSARETVAKLCTATLHSSPFSMERITASNCPRARLRRFVTECMSAGSICM